MLVGILCCVISIFIISMLVDYLKHLQKIRNMPPGPTPLPVIGNLNIISGKPLHLVLTELSEIYGEIYSISIGMDRIVIISEIEIANKTLPLKSFSGRCLKNRYFHISTRGYTDLMCADYSKNWRKLRKMTQTGLNMLHDGSGDIESKIIRECKALRGRLLSTQSRAIAVREELGICITNIASSLLFGMMYNIEENEFDILQKFNCSLVSSSFVAHSKYYIDWINYVFHTENFQRYLDNVAKRDVFIRKRLKEHLATYREDNIRDFTDLLIQLSENKSKLPEIDSNIKNEIEMILSDIMAAACDSTRSTIEWMILYLLHWPDLQDLIFNEIKTHIGKNKYPSFQDKPSFHTFNAFISESLRFSTFAPSLIPHKTLEDENIDSYDVPKDTVIIYNAWKIHRDEKYWEKPFNFDHTRWFDENSKYRTNKSYLPFSKGVRSCLGRSLAIKEIFFILTRLICDFRIEPCGVLPSLNGVSETTNTSEDYHIRLVRRN